MSSLLPQPPPPKTPARTDPSVEALRSEFTKLRPQENTYYCNPHAHIPSVSSATTASSGLQPADRSKDSVGTSSCHRVPCESDESLGFSQYLSSSDSSTGPKGNVARTAWSQGNGDCSACDSQAGRSQTNSVAGSSSQGIVVNATKQQMVQKMALYEKGLSSPALFSYGSGSYGEESTQSQEPVESEESEY